VRRVLPLLVLLVALAGCGGSGGPKVPDGYESHDLGGGWLLLWKADGSDAKVQRDGTDLPADGISIRPLGPEPGETVGGIPQVAAEIEARTAIENASLFVDGTALDLKEGALSDRRKTVYGAPVSSLSSGRHVVVAAVRAGESAAARAWTFSVR
jgi:hypothetical protein